MDDGMIHEAHCSVFRCVYGDPNCPVAEVEPDPTGQRTRRALDALASEPDGDGLGEEYAVRNIKDGWVYALPKLMPKFLAGQRGTREAAEWHLRQVAGPDEEDWPYFEIVRRPVGPWQAVTTQTGDADDRDE